MSASNTFTVADDGEKPAHVKEAKESPAELPPQNPRSLTS